jgi:hypothetical protein
MIQHAMSVFILAGIRFIKFAGIMLYSAGVAGSFASSVPKDRKRAVHTIASTGLLLSWVAGYLLSVLRNVPLTELWVLAGIVTSFGAQALLVRSLKRPPTLRALALVLVPLTITVALMTARPTWLEFGL